MVRSLATRLLVALLLLGAGFLIHSPALTGRAAAQAAPTVLLQPTSRFGTVLTSGDRMALYTFSSDDLGVSRCTGPCASAWPPLLALNGVAVPPPGLGGTLAVGVLTPSIQSGRRQVTYNGHPLYSYSGDRQAGTASGAGVAAFGGVWQVAQAEPARSSPPAGPRPSPPSPSPPTALIVVIPGSAELPPGWTVTFAEPLPPGQGPPPLAPQPGHTPVPRPGPARVVVVSQAPQPAQVSFDGTMLTIAVTAGTLQVTPGVGVTCSPPADRGASVHCRVPAVAPAVGVAPPLVSFTTSPLPGRQGTPPPRPQPLLLPNTGAGRPSSPRRGCAFALLGVLAGAAWASVSLRRPARLDEA